MTPALSSPEILALEPRRLDCCIGYALFGWRWYQVARKNEQPLCGFWPTDSAWTCWNLPDDAEKLDDVWWPENRFKDWNRLASRGEAPTHDRGLPFYSRDGGPMLEVLARITEMGWCYHLSSGPDIRATLYVRGSPPPGQPGTHVGVANTLPEAVARAALLTVGDWS